MLNHDEIKELLEKSKTDPKLGLGCIPNPLEFDPSQIGAASLDIRLGCWFLALQQSKRSEINLLNPNPTPVEDADGKYYYVSNGNKFVVHPGRFVLASTLEWISIPSDIGGLITGKSSLGRRGLIIETAAGIQPEFNGCLTLEIANVGEVPIAITPGMKIAQIYFHRLNSKPSEIKRTNFAGRRKPVFGNYSVDRSTVDESSEGRLF